MFVNHWVLGFFIVVLLVSSWLIHLWWVSSLDPLTFLAESNFVYSVAASWNAIPHTHLLPIFKMYHVFSKNLGQFIKWWETRWRNWEHSRPTDNYLISNTWQNTTEIKGDIYLCMSGQTYYRLISNDKWLCF